MGKRMSSGLKGCRGRVESLQDVIEATKAMSAVIDVEDVGWKGQVAQTPALTICSSVQGQLM